MMEFGFLLKKVITFFIEPYGMVFSLFVIGLYFLFAKKESYAKLFLTMACGMMFLFAYPPFANFLVQNLENQYPKYDYKTEVRYIHVLGNEHNTDITQPLSSQINSTSIKRDLEGIIIYKNTKGSKLIFTGYEGYTDTPTAIMNAKLAKTLGVDEKDLLINPKPKDTKEEALFTRSVVGDEPFVLVTSATHMPRAMRLFKSLGMNPIPAPTDFYKKEFDGYLKSPRVFCFLKSQVAVHEYIGILWAMIRG